jgi:sporadic carbohydrate cluster protein (TIGR04323 family)
MSKASQETLLSVGGSYRGYIATRPVRGDRIPHHVQGLVIRDYAQRMNLICPLLPAVEYAMPGCYMMLESVLKEVPATQGVILYSLFMLPERASRRQHMYDRVFAAGGSLHGALENIALWGHEDTGRVEDIFRVNQFAHAKPPADVAAVLGGS